MQCAGVGMGGKECFVVAVLRNAKDADVGEGTSFYLMLTHEDKDLSHLVTVEGTVDHPADTDIFVDERFVVPPSKLAITTVEKPHKIARAMDDQGRDVTDIVSTLDGKYLDTFSRGQYQGVTRDHYVEAELGDDAPTSGSLYLIAKGWMHPSDSSINVAITQGHHEHARGLSLEVPDGRKWGDRRNTARSSETLIRKPGVGSYTRMY